MTTSTLTLEFPAVAGRTVTAVCDGGEVTSDAGVLLLTRADTRLGLTARLAAGLRDTHRIGRRRLRDGNSRHAEGRRGTQSEQD